MNIVGDYYWVEYETYRRRDFIYFGFHYECNNGRYYPYPHISLYSKEFGIENAASKNSGESNGCRIIAVWKVIKFKRRPAPEEQWWTPETHPHLMQPKN